MKVTLSTPPDPELVSEVRSWLKRAAEDLRAGEFEMGAQPPLSEDVLFHTQQAAEKSLEAFLVWHGEPFRKTHSLEEIGEQCLAIDTTLSSFLDRVIPLSEYAWRYRYPGAPDEPTPDEAYDALVRARAMYDAVLERLPTEVRP